MKQELSPATRAIIERFAKESDAHFQKARREIEALQPDLDPAELISVLAGASLINAATDLAFAISGRKPTNVSVAAGVVAIAKQTSQILLVSEFTERAVEAALQAAEEPERGGHDWRPDATLPGVERCADCGIYRTAEG